ncbi:MAG: hypothetical protein K2K13_02745 [Clostridiales bacterium]|nr:hypothetical protein [Clostridiales bacterium]
MDNQDKTTFSLDDEEIVEEEVIDRDEEYDDGYEDEDYGDEEYDDEYDEDYGDEDYGDEEYDDGYNDDYYDDRLNKVLDELAELKRGMVPATQQQQPQPIMPPQYIYQPTAPPAGSEVVMYNEISRLRDELARNQNSLEMQKELTRIKEDMQRDQKFAEAQYNAEIQRLQSKIDDLLKNGSSPQSELPAGQEPERIEGGKSLDVDKLLSINEAILRAMRDTDARMQNEIGQLKKQLDEMPSVKELNGAVSSMKKAANSMDTGNLTKLSGEIAALKAVLEGTPMPTAAAAAPAAATPVVSEVSAAELLRQLYEIKTVIGNASPAAVKRAQTISELVNDFKKVTYDVHSQTASYKDKLNAVYAYVKRLTDSNEPDAIDLVQATNTLIDELGDQPLNKQSFTAVAEFCAERGMTTITSAMRDSADRFFNLVGKIEDAPVESYGDYLPDLVEEINTLQGNKYEAENAATVGEITTELVNENSDKAAVKEMVERLVEITVADVLDLPELDLPKAYKPAHVQNDETLFTKLADLKSAVMDRPTPTIIPTSEDGELSVDEAALQQILYAVDDLKNKLENATGNNDVAGALEELRNNYLDITNRLVDMSEKLQEPPVQAEATEGAAMTDEERQIMLDDLGYIRAKLDDYETFFNNLSDLRTELNQTQTGGGEDLTAPVTEQLTTLMTDITAQFDKLYEDVTNVIIESESNIIGKLGDGNDANATLDAIEAAKADILAETQSIKDSLVGVSDANAALDAIDAAKSDILIDTQAIRDSLVSVSDAILMSPTAEAIEQLRADVNAYIDSASVNMESATSDRQRLLDDIAFLREQAELAIAEGDQIPDGAEAVQDTEKLIDYLDEIAARVSLINTVADDAAATKESVTTIGDNVAALSDNVATVSDALNAVTDSVAAASDSIAAINDNFVAVNDNFAVINDNVNAISENVVAARDAANSALDALTPITEQLNSILERLETPTTETEQTVVENNDYAADELALIRDNLNAIIDTLTLMPQSDDVVVARDNTLAILDALATMPQADDVALIRENVSTLLESVNALTENVTALGENSNDNQPVIDEITALREAFDVTAEDIKLVLEKIDLSEQYAATDKQEIIDAVNAIKEEIHINTLDENMSASGIDGETREALLGEIAEIRERLGNIENATQAVNDVNVAAIDQISAQLVELQSMLESKFAAETEGQADQDQLDSDNMQALIAELSSIKEKLDASSEYDTVEEILSLREDIKAARIVDQDEVSGELESIKNELAAISSGNILDEIRALREDIANLPVGDEGGSEATDGEINLVLNEIVSLRDEVFAFKDEVLNATGATAESQTEPTEQVVQSSEDMLSVLDELSALRADQTALSENIDELKDLVSRRTTVVSGDEEGATTTANVDELNIVLDEIINLKGDIDRIEESLGGDRLNAIAEQVEDIRAVLDELRSNAGSSDAQTTTETYSESGAPVTAEVDLTPVLEQLDAVNAALEEIKLVQEATVAEEGGEATGTLSERFDALEAEMADIKSALADMAPIDYAAEMAEMRAQIESLRAENEQLKADGTDMFAVQIDELKDFIRDLTETAHASAPVDAAAADGSELYATLIDEIRGLKEQVAAVQAAPMQATAGLDEQALQDIRDMLAAQTEQNGLAGELGEIRDEIAQLRSLTTVAAESGGNVEVQSLRDELEEIKSMLASPDSLMGVAEDVTAIKADVQTLKEEPDLGVMSEILALRDEFQALREQIEDVKRIAGETESESDDTLMAEIQSLRDQLFAISMANVNDPASGESNYESYNNIILDEIASLRDQVASAGSARDIEIISDEFAKLKAAIDKREAMVEALADRVATLGNDATNNKILEELAVLRTDMANQRDADLTTLNFMSEMAHLLERQNQYLTQNAGTKISDEIESLKAEIASSDAVAEEVAKLREVMTQTGNAADNDTILAELADLREELSKEKPSQENALILDAISRLRDEITVIAERERVRDLNSDADLSDSLSDLKEQLNEIAGIMEPNQHIQPAQPAQPVQSVQPEKKPAASTATGKKRGRKPGQKNSAKTGGTSTASTTGKKRGRKPAAQKQAEPEVEEVVINTPAPEKDEFEALIDRQAGLLGGDSDMSLNPTVTADTMDVADRLAKQVANKLIMEQLVEQLGDGGVSEDRVDEILRDILPHEFNTIAETEASDKVRRLANQLVLNKLRARLNGNKDED